ncbi:MAG TPA: hypothetical protein PKD54_12100, partial [Pirellulaceae bacterium]|nr:hypothetical protein [Pirellulaceae bacterium]
MAPSYSVPDLIYEKPAALDVPGSINSWFFTVNAYRSKSNKWLLIKVEGAIDGGGFVANIGGSEGPTGKCRGGGTGCGLCIFAPPWVAGGGF